MTSRRHPPPVTNRERLTMDVFMAVFNPCQAWTSLFTKNKQMTANFDCRIDGHLFAVSLLADLYRKISAFRFNNKFPATTVDGSHLVLFIDIACDRNRDIGADLTEVCGQVYVER